MATKSDDYTRGEMPVHEHKDTFGGFVTMTVWGSAFLAAIIFALVLIFAAHVAWPIGIMGGATVAVLAGLVLGQKTGWYGLVVGLTVLGFIIGGVFQLASGLSAS